MVGFGSWLDETPTLDGEPVSAINPDLTCGIDLTTAYRLEENKGICFMGTTKVGDFDIEPDVARKMLNAPLNPNGRPNSDVVRPWINAKDFASRSRGHYIIDFGTETSESEAALYEYPFEYAKKHVYPDRATNKRGGYRTRWWLHGEPRPELRRAISGLTRYILTPQISKHRIFDWFRSNSIPDHTIFAFARQDDYFFGILCSSPQEFWAIAKGTQLESRPRYTPDSTFDTFPFPWPPGKEPSEEEDPRVKAIADAARELVRLRDIWLNPPNSSPEELKTRTLTNLYNKQPAWLQNAHRALDEAVFAAYGWPANLSKEEILTRLLALNHERAKNNPPAAKKPSPK
jgi:type II restriction/modification system DNA methylase subunit YeeA